MAKRYQHTAVIKFTGKFPIDMLRYDCCHPATESDSGKITRSLVPGSFRAEAVTVVRNIESKDPRWTVGRWNSFSCTVEPVLSSRLPND